MKGYNYNVGDNVTVAVATDGWARFPEVIAYAAKRGITISEAIRVLVNTGLSHNY